MTRILSMLLVALFALSSIVGYTAHASDFSGVHELTAVQVQDDATSNDVSLDAYAGSTAYADSTDNDSSGSGSNGDPVNSHHHSTCQGHHVAQPNFRSRLSDVVWQRTAGPLIANTPAPASAFLETELRPPIA